MAPSKNAYNTPAGRDLVKRRLALRGIRPHDYQLDGVTRFLDGTSLMVAIATGSGKTGYFAFTMMMMQDISEDPSLAIENVTFPKNPAMVIVLPTKALQDDMKASLTKLGLDAVVINGDEEKANPGVWKDCEAHHSMILISPEECVNPSFRTLLNNEAFGARACRMGVDEAHLMVSWGTTFRTSYQQLGHVRSRFKYKSPDGGLIPLLAASATIREGEPREAIAKSLELDAGGYEILRRSNLRPDMRIIVREMTTSLTGASFPDLDWTLGCEGNTVIFCRTIGLGFRVAAYLWRKGIAKGIPNLRSKLRLFNSLNSRTYNEQTLGFLNNSEDTSITIATDVLSVGWDSPNTKNVVVFGEPDTLDDVLQKFGRAGRDKKKVQSPLAILYHSKGAVSSAERVLARAGQQVQPLPKDKAPSMDRSIAEFTVANCKNECIDRLYSNPGFDIPCSCPRCATEEPTPGSSEESEQERPGCGRCSSCVPHEDTDPDFEAVKTKQAKPTKQRAKAGQGISKAMRDLAFVRLLPVRRKIFEELEGDDWSPPELYLPDESINALADGIYSIKTEADIGTRLPDREDLTPFRQSILDVCKELLQSFEDIREQERTLRAAKRATKDAAMRSTHESPNLEDSEDSEDEDSEIEGSTFLAVEREDDENAVVECRDVCGGRSGIKLTINLITKQISTSTD